MLSSAGDRAPSGATRWRAFPRRGVMARRGFGEPLLLHQPAVRQRPRGALGRQPDASGSATPARRLDAHRRRPASHHRGRQDPKAFARGRGRRPLGLGAPPRAADALGTDRAAHRSPKLHRNPDHDAELHAGHRALRGRHWNAMSRGGLRPRAGAGPQPQRKPVPLARPRAR
jgi:hypothetical protein